MLFPLRGLFLTIRILCTILAYFPKIGFFHLHSVCISVSTLINFRMPQPIFMKLGMHIMATEPVSTT
jgi:hypothetical protein